MEWIKVSERLPEENFVLVFGANHYGKMRILRARFVSKFTESLDFDFNDTDNGDFDHATEEWFLKSGWYECNEHEEVNWKIDFEVTHWMPLPEPPES